METTNRIVSTGDGRMISVTEAGQPNGIPILVHHGTPGSKLLYDAWIDTASAHGIRLISYDRPGYGDSTPQPARTIASAARDVVAIARELHLARLCVWGSSGGGPHALACAALLPDLVAAAGVLASVAPFQAAGLEWLAGMGQANTDEFGAALTGRQAIQQFVEAETPSLVSGDLSALIQTFRSLLSPVDAAVFTDEFGRFVLGHMREGIRSSREGWVDDDLAFTVPWGFELTDIRVPVLLMHGEQDHFVPVSHGKWLAGKIPNVDVRILPDDGHLTLTTRHIPQVHAWLMDKM